MASRGNVPTFCRTCFSGSTMTHMNRSIDVCWVFSLQGPISMRDSCVAIRLPGSENSARRPYRSSPSLAPPATRHRDHAGAVQSRRRGRGRQQRDRAAHDRRARDSDRGRRFAAYLTLHRLGAGNRAGDVLGESHRIPDGLLDRIADTVTPASPASVCISYSKWHDRLRRERSPTR